MQSCWNLVKHMSEWSESVLRSICKTRKYDSTKINSLNVTPRLGVTFGVPCAWNVTLQRHTFRAEALKVNTEQLVLNISTTCSPGSHSLWKQPPAALLERVNIFTPKHKSLEFLPYRDTFGGILYAFLVTLLREMTGNEGREEQHAAKTSSRPQRFNVAVHCKTRKCRWARHFQQPFENLF